MKRKSDFDKITEQLEKLQALKIRWGVHGEENAKKMFQNEFGSGKIPERPAFRITFGSSTTQQMIAKATHAAIDKVMKGADAKISAEVIGFVGLGELKKVFRSNIAPPNAPSTIARKGEGKNTLFDTGDLFRSLGYEII